jgi:molybdopterin molybdotransferase
VEKVDLLSALHRVCAEDIIAQRDIPLTDNAAMDGYAVQHRDLAGVTPERPALLDVLEVLPAGKTPQCQITPGTAIKIMTGAPLPVGADTVVQVEHTNASDTRVMIYRVPQCGSNLRRRVRISTGECVAVPDTFASAELGCSPPWGKRKCSCTSVHGSRFGYRR